MLTPKEQMKLLLKTVALSQALIDSFDELEQHGLVRKNIKRFGKPFKNQVLIYINNVFDEAKTEAEQDAYRDAGQYIVEKSKEIDELFK